MFVFKTYLHNICIISCYTQCYLLVETNVDNLSTSAMVLLFLVHWPLAVIVEKRLIAQRCQLFAVLLAFL